MATLSVEKEKLNVAKPFAFHNGDGEAAVFDVIGAIKKWRITSQESSSAWVENSGSEDAFRLGNCAGKNFRVFVRVRPVLCELERETQKNFSSLSVFHPFVFLHKQAERLGMPVQKLSTAPHRFDGAFGGQDKNEALYDACARPLVSGLLNREGCFDSTLIAFGQTGAGKTFTITGIQEKCIHEVCNNKDKDSTVSVAFFENRGTKVHDLLASKQELEVLESADGGIHVNKLSWHSISTGSDALAYLADGSSLRSTHATINNPESSRSHSFFVIRVTGGDGNVRTLTLVDLAGSERKRDVRNHSQERIAEMQEINWSLGTLKQCISDMLVRETIDPKKHVNFRNSKLTLLLKGVFTNPEQQSVFIGCLAPLSASSLHSRNTLAYMRQLVSLDSSLNGRVASAKDLENGLQMFYLEYCPTKANIEAVRGVLGRFKGRERELYNGIKRKYRSAPDILLNAPGMQLVNRAENPLCWRRQEMRKFLEKDLEGGKYKEYAECLNVSGKQFYSFTVADVIRRCGGGSKCAAFNDPDHALHDKADSVKTENGDDLHQQRAGHETNARAIYEAFRLKKKAFGK
eukprot:g2728.t1